MANTKSAKKQARKNIKRRDVNLARKTAIKSAAKKVLLAIEQGEDIKVTQELMRDIEAKLARAKGKGTLHKKAASRKIGRLAKRVAAASK
ncbi:MAG TPA: 30S ribosomal protein S20 [Candidatus Babeliales bacterium]|nr:30S ribosomal protein S20 [Candidatus Babeliales bacterium]